MTEMEIQKSINANDARNTELLDAIRREGVSLDQPRSVDVHFWAPDQRRAALLARELYAGGFLVLVLAPCERTDGTQCWNVEAGVNRSPNEAAARATTEELVRLSARFESTYDGWGTRL